MIELASLDAFFAAASRRTVDRSAIVDQILLGGWRTRVDRQTSDADVADAGSVVDGLAAVCSDRGRFDPSEAICKLIADGRDDPSSFWRSRYIAAGRARILETVGKESGAPSRNDLLALPAQRFQVHFRRAFQLDPRNDGRLPRLRLPLPIEDTQLRDLKIELDPHADTTEPRILAGRIEARPLGDDPRTATIGATFRFTAVPGQPSRETDSLLPAATFLNPSEGPVQATAAVRALADRLAPGAAMGRATFERFWDFMMDEMVSGPVPHERLGAGTALDWVIDNRWFDCHLGSSLLVSLCRAKGIPARLVGGYLLTPSAPTEHYWLEVWLDEEGWIPADLFSWGLSEGGLDPAWRQLFVGATDYRMKTQSFPDRFTGPLGIRFPREWHRLERATPDGIVSEVVEIPTGRVVIRDSISVRLG